MGSLEVSIAELLFADDRRPAEVGSLELGTAELLSADDCSFQLLPEGYCQGTLLGLF